MRPRGGQVWRSRSDGREALVLSRRATNPMSRTRPRLGRAAWVSVISCAPWPPGAGHPVPVGMHEADFARIWEYVRTTRRAEREYR